MTVAHAPATGGCLCGATRFRIDDPPATSFICHCRICRRASGGMHVAWVTVRAELFRFEGAVPSTYRSSPGVQRTFCAHCGTSLTWQKEGGSEIDVTLAAFDRVEDFPPADELWTSHRPTWDMMGHRLKQWPEDFPGQSVGRCATYKVFPALLGSIPSVAVPTKPLAITPGCAASISSMEFSPCWLV